MGFILFVLYEFKIFKSDIFKTNFFIFTALLVTVWSDTPTLASASLFVRI